MPSLRNYIASKTDAASAKEYQQNVEQIRDAEAAKNSSDKGMVMKKETLNEEAQEDHHCGERHRSRCHRHRSIRDVGDSDSQKKKEYG